MASVYEESYLTLAVALAPGDGSGFLHENRQRSYYYSQPLRGMDHVKIRNPHYAQDQNRFPQPLLTRAWTLQERVIPQRMITFSYTVTFECREANWTESGSGLMENPHVPRISPWSSGDRDTYRALIETEDNRDEIYRYWIEQVVMPYSYRKLTRASDKLPAVSALAEKFQMKLDDQYVAGMWMGDLYTSLGWRSMTKEDLILNRDHSASTPSWSWASVEGPVFMGQFLNEQAQPRRRNLRMEISGCEVTPRGVNSFGELRGGRLSVWGPCLRCRLTINFGQDDKGHPTHKFGPLNPAYGELIASTWPPGFLKLAYKLDDVCFDSALRQVVVEYEEGQTCPGLMRSDAEMQEPVEGMVTCMLLFQKRSGTYLIREFLILGQEPSQRGLFQRLGILSIKLVLTDIPGHVHWFDELPEQSLIIR
jgi:hypothetical protein